MWKGIVIKFEALEASLPSRFNAAIKAHGQPAFAACSTLRRRRRNKEAQEKTGAAFFVISAAPELGNAILWRVREL